jgi:hypothetical protein
MDRKPSIQPAGRAGKYPGHDRQEQKGQREAGSRFHQLAISGVFRFSF